MNISENSKLFQGIDESYKYAVVYTQVVIEERSKKKYYDGNANFFKSVKDAKKDVSILKSITNKRYVKVYIVKR